ncbi:hypothetical protein [Mycolicibacterium senegalense]|uniref:hypothetical protein n=1 Tax=Mycolicibacterium senegalense TaxID=1796 RepID=UPI0011C079BA|nr:hypothetical protein [Mycolicibacterium senegalense]MCV7333574.1 hypothetical protein [Mycolicibacterium senegalense]MDR7288045.1 hypothetical protein [Mycolicibacterium senegalense]QZA25034.1 hypothetical protein K3U95_02665 [Mycolicibacterium senegalense]
MTRAQRSPAISIANSVTGVARGWAAKDAVFTPPATAPATPRHREGGLWRRTLTAVRAALAGLPRPDLKRPYYPPLREGFVEDAAMAREMWRL